MDATLLRAFAAVCRHGNYTRAAAELGLSQSAVWRQMQKLERDLAAPLFDLLGKRLHLTQAGHVLLPEARRMLADAERVRQAIGALSGAVGGTLRIGASTTPALYLLPAVVGPFLREFPALDLRYEGGNSERISRLLLENEIDVGFVGGAVAHDSLTAERVASDELVAIAPPGHPAARSRPSPLARVAGEPFLLREPGSGTRRCVDAWLARHRVRLSRTTIVQSPETIKRLVAAGAGLAFLSRFAVAEELRRGELVRVPLREPPPSRPILMLRHAGKHDAPATRELARRCREGLRARARERAATMPR